MAKFIFTEDAWQNWIKEQIVEKPIKKVRKNATKRITLPKWLRLKVIERSGGFCEEKGCKSLAVAIHHLLSVSEFPEFQHLLGNLIHLCMKHHRARHLSLPSALFVGL
jgi:hypothetical protein